MKTINILSLFDGISVAQLALKQLNIPITNYYASEIDKHAIAVTQHHFPNTIQLGDVTGVNGTDLPPIDLMIFGSPCQDLSGIRMNRQGLEGEQSGLFFEALRILKEVQPRFWCMENVASMSKVDQEKISAFLGVEPVYINSNLVSAANRARLYWANFDIRPPKDRGIKLQDILKSDYADKDKANCVLTKNVSNTKAGLNRYILKGIGQVAFRDSIMVNPMSKYKKMDFAADWCESEIERQWRLLNIKELERLQTLPEGYVEPYVGKTAAHHCIGNAFTLEVVKGIISQIDFEGNGSKTGFTEQN